MSPHGPMLVLKMKTMRSPPPPPSAQDFHDLPDRFRVMIRQEQTTYKCRDYLLRRHLEKLAVDPVVDEREPTNDCRTSPPTSEVDSTCREKMCEWSYRVVDHFHANREIVAVSFSYLDRFLDRCSCDRTAFKLAAMTTLYIATKIFNSREISMTSLAELSRGEFDVEHIAEMEGIVLQTLGWHVNPPTAQCFINHLHNLLPPTKTSIKRTIYQRACFFAELSIFDYYFVTEAPSTIALSAILNAMEGLDPGQLPEEVRKTFLHSVRQIAGIDHDADGIDTVCNKLWEVYGVSEQFKKHDTIPLTPKETYAKNSTFEKEGSFVNKSPVSVAVVEQR